MQNGLGKICLKGEKINQRNNKQQKKCLLINITLDYIHRDNVKALLCAKVNGFESNGTTENECLENSLFYPSITKKLILHRQILCNINLNCLESTTENG